MSRARATRIGISALFCVSFTLVLPSTARAADGHTVGFDEIGLRLTIPALIEQREVLERDDQRLAAWTGRLGETPVRIELYLLEETGANEPGEVAELLIDFFRKRGNFDVVESFLLEGEYGYASYVSGVEARKSKDGQVVGRQYILGGLLESAGYALYVECDAGLDEAGQAAIRGMLEKGIAYEGPVRDPSWTDDEARERWVRDAPESTHEEFLQKLGKSRTAKKALVRTENYLIMTNSSSGALFAKQMEANYEEIKELFPFDEVEGMRLMPVFLFQTPDEYYDYYVKIAGTSKDSARKSKGHAWRDYYATWYEAPKDPVHLHEAVHQIFKNRLLLGGGGSWFQEGVAEYAETSKNERNEAARLVREGKHVPLSKLVRLESLLYSSEDDLSGASGASNAYKQAALLIEFLRESKLGKAKFSEFLQLMGRVPRRDPEKIEGVFRTVYGLGLDEIDAAFREYCEKR